MTPDDLTAAGQALFGSVWQTSLARNLRNSDGRIVNDRTVRRWITKELQIPEWAEIQILDLLVQTQTQRIQQVLATASPMPTNVTLTLYDTDADLRKVTTDHWSAAFHGRMVGGLAQRLRKQGLVVRLIPLNAREYFRWLGRRENNPARRSQFAALHTKTSH
jgi:hypothetical protein